LRFGAYLFVGSTLNSMVDGFQGQATLVIPIVAFLMLVVSGWILQASSWIRRLATR
jgi:cytochrome c oxidase subunit IV